jgi:hypothetical protein
VVAYGVFGIDLEAMGVDTRGLERSEVIPPEVLILRFFSGPVGLGIVLREMPGLFNKFKFPSFLPAKTNSSGPMSNLWDQDFRLSLVHWGLSFLGIF